MTLISPINPPTKRINGQALLDKFGDGQWHWIDTIAAYLGVSTEAALSHIKKRHWHGGSSAADATIKQVGRSFQIQIFTRERTVSVSELVTRLQPIIEHLRAEGKKSMATSTISAARVTASRLQNLLDEWAEEPAAGGKPDASVRAPLAKRNR